MRLLVRLPNWLGDLLMVRPLLHGLRASFPQAEIWAVGVPASRLLERERLWNEWRGSSDALPARSGGSDLARAFDAALVLPPSFSSAWRLRRLRIGRRIGFAGEGRSWLLTDALRRPARGETHLSEEYFRIGARLGAAPAPVPPLLPTAPESAEAGARLRSLGAGERPVLILAPGAVYGPAKQWGQERFAELGRRFAARGFAVLVCGAASDRTVADAIAAGIGPGAHPLAGRTSLEEQLALCASARATVSNDSGLAHLAAACGAPTVAIFGSTSSAWTAPRGRRVRVLQHSPVCSPCFQRTCAIGYRCLEAVTVDEVERATLESLVDGSGR